MPDSLFQYVEQRTERRNYGSVSEYVRDLIRNDQRKFEEQQVEQMEREVRYHREVIGRQYK